MLLEDKGQNSTLFLFSLELSEHENDDGGDSLFDDKIPRPEKIHTCYPKGP